MVAAGREPTLERCPVSTLKARPCNELVIRSTPSAAPCAKREQTCVLVAAVLGSSMAFIDSSVVNVALPKMESDLATTLPAMTWVINAYTLCMSALLLIGGAAADQIGRRRIFITGLSIFAVASIGCGLAPAVEVLILAGAVQGVGAALLIPCSLAIIGAAFDEKERGAAIGVWSGASAITAGAAPLMGGWLVDHGSWRTIFLINPVIAVPTILIALRHLPESVDPDAKKGLDGMGATVAFFGLGWLVYGLIAASDRSWSSPIVVGSLLAGAVLLVAFVWIERRSPAPMMPLNVFRSLTFTGVNILTLLLYGSFGGPTFRLGRTPRRPLWRAPSSHCGTRRRSGGILPAEHAGNGGDLLDHVLCTDGHPGIWDGHYRGPADNHGVEFSGSAPDGRRFGHQQCRRPGRQPAHDRHPRNRRHRRAEPIPRSTPG